LIGLQNAEFLWIGMTVLLINECDRLNNDPNVSASGGTDCDSAAIVAYCYRVRNPMTLAGTACRILSSRRSKRTSRYCDITQRERIDLPAAR